MSGRGRRAKRNDWGSVTKMDKGTYRLRYWASGVDGYKRRSKTIHASSAREAGEELARLRLLHSKDKRCPTVKECWDTWWKPEHDTLIEQGDYRASTMRTVESVYYNHVAPRWADVSVDSIAPLDVQDWLLSLNHTAASQGRILLKQLLDYAVRYESISANPLTLKYRLPSKSTVAGRPKGVFSYEEIGVLLNAARGSWIEPCIIFQVLGGCRVGESLWPTSVELINIGGVDVAIAHIDGQIDTQGAVTHELKTEWSRRPVVVAGRWAKRLKELSDEAAGQRLTRFDGIKTVKRSTLNKEWADLLARTQLKRIPMRNLRAAWQTNCRWVLKMPPWIVEPMMGHVGESTTGRHYDRPTAEVFAEAAATAYKDFPFDINW